MGVKIENAASTRNRGKGRRRNDEWTMAETYLNVGFWTEDPKTGDPMFLSLVGIGIENIRPPEGLNSSNPAFRARAEAIEELRQRLLKVAQGMKPGQSEPLQGFEFEIRKRKGKESAIPAEENPFMQQAAGLFDGLKKTGPDKTNAGTETSDEPVEGGDDRTIRRKRSAD
jgi:hypothetical protein